MRHSLFRVQVEVDPDEVQDHQESHTPREAKKKYSPWILEPSGQILTFEGATFAAQLAREPTPKVRIALHFNDGAQPLISGAFLRECRPMTSNWLPDYIEDTEINYLRGYKIEYSTPGVNKKESARGALTQDVRDNFRFEIEEITVHGKRTTIEVYIPEKDTANHSKAPRLFPTATEIVSLGRVERNNG